MKKEKVKLASACVVNRRCENIYPFPVLEVREKKTISGMVSIEDLKEFRSTFPDSGMVSAVLSATFLSLVEGIKSGKTEGELIEDLQKFWEKVKKKKTGS